MIPVSLWGDGRVEAEGAFEEGVRLAAIEGFEAGAGALEAAFDIEAFGLALVTFALEESFEGIDMAPGELAFGGNFGIDPRIVPIATDHGLAGEEAADVGMVEVFPFPVAVGHDVEEGLERRAGQLDRAVLEVEVGDDSLLGLDDVVDAVDEVVDATAVPGGASPR